MLKFYYNLIINNFFKFIFITLLFTTIQIGYEVYELKKGVGKTDLCAEYDKLITYDVKFYEYLRAMNIKLERQEEFNYINNINATFYSFVLNLQENFYKNIEKVSMGNIIVSKRGDKFRFRISILDSSQEIKMDSKLEKKIEKKINDIFFLTYDEFALESIFSLVQIPRAKFFTVKLCNEKTYHFLDKIYYQFLISIALSFCLIIFKTQLKKNPKLKKKNPKLKKKIQN